MQQAAFAAGVPVPRPYWLADGRRRARRGLRDGARRGRDACRGACCATMRYAAARAAMIGAARRDPGARARHRPAPPRPRRSSPRRRRASRRHWRSSTATKQIFRGIAPEPHPVFELAFRWLRQRLPDAAAPHARARRLPHRQRRSSDRKAARDPRLGAVAHRRSCRGSGLAVRARLALRQRRSCRSAASATARRCSPPTATPAARRSASTACDSGRCSATSSGRSSASSQAKTHLDGLVKSVELASLAAADGGDRVGVAGADSGVLRHRWTPMATDGHR